MGTRSYNSTVHKERFAGLCALLLTMPFSIAASAQQKEVITFKGTGDAPIIILNEKGEIQEEVNKEQLKKITLAPKWSVPKPPDEQSREQKPLGNTAQPTRKSVKSNKTIDEMLKTRQQTLKKRKAYANRPPRKRK